MLGYLLFAAAIGFGALWLYRTNLPHISEAEATSVALESVQRIYHRPSQVQSARYFADGGRSESQPGASLPGNDGCWILPDALCPPTPLWVVRVHTVGFPDSIWVINATNRTVLQEVGTQ
jgi:hypothetical protein